MRSIIQAIERLKRVRAMLFGVVLPLLVIGYVYLTFSWKGEQSMMALRGSLLHAINLSKITSVPTSQIEKSDNKFLLLRQSIFYNEMLRKNHLSFGMVVNRDQNGNMIDECDSLLFTSIYYFSLKKMSLDHQAEELWIRLKKNLDFGRKLIRHPRCSLHTSRDMVFGLLLILSQHPRDGKLILSNILKTIDQNAGFFSQGSIFTSLVTPAMINVMKLLAKDYDILAADLPGFFFLGYASDELTSVFVNRGYEAHLVAVNLLINMELNSHNGKYISKEIRNQWQWIGRNLYMLDEKNLFFEYLWYRSLDFLPKKVLRDLQHKLLTFAKAFPEGKLPQNCDRKADYLWQRDSEEYKAKTNDCYYVFSGVDFIFMSALLLQSFETTQ